MNTYKSNFKWWLAGWLCRVACWLRGETWHVADSWHGVPGNRASELEQRIWQHIVVVDATARNRDPRFLDSTLTDLKELSQAAGAAWGHIWPEKDQP